MIGVVIWADAAENKAVIWCEDQKDLAYFLPSAVSAKGNRPLKGDLVEFDSFYRGSLRLAKNLSVVEAAAADGLGESLRSGASWARRNNIHRGAVAASASIPERAEAERNDRPMPRREERESAKILPFPELMRA